MPIFSEGRVLPGDSRANRKIANASKGHCTGFSVLGKGAGIRVMAESATEQRHLHIQSVRPDVADVREQVRFDYGRQDEHRHFFDMVVSKVCGERIAYTVKPTSNLRSGRFIDEMQTVAWWVAKKRFATSVRLLTEEDIDAVTLHNANINIALRDVDLEAEEAARAIIVGLRGAVTIKALTDAIGLEGRGYRALLRLVSTGELRLLRQERITPETLVHWKGSMV